MKLLSFLRFCDMFTNRKCSEIIITRVFIFPLESVLLSVAQPGLKLKPVLALASPVLGLQVGTVCRCYGDSEGMRWSVRPHAGEIANCCRFFLL